MNLLKFKPFGLIARAKFFPIIPQFFTLSIYFALIIGSIGVGYDPKTAPFIANTNFANQIVWNIWWPVTLVIAVIAGHLWCAVCPLELVNSLAGRIGLKKEAPGFLRSGWAVTLIFAFILFGAGKYLGLQAIPRTLAIYLASLLIIAVVSGLIMGKRSFCSYICPLGSIIGMYSYIAVTEWRVNNQSVCNKCKTKDCVSIKNRYKLFGRSCTSNLNPARMTDNRQCLLCTQCLKACPDSNFRFSLRLPFADFFKKIKLIPAEMGMLLLIIGFVNNNWRALVLFTLIPLFLCLIVSWKSPGLMLNAFMVLLIPTTAAAHMLHAFRAQLWNWPLYKYNFMDPLGVRTATRLAEKALVIDRSLMDPAWRLFDNMTVLLHVSALAVSVAIILKSALTVKIGPRGKCFLTLSVISYIVSFYFPI